MKIENSAIEMFSLRRFSQKYEKKEELQAWDNRGAQIPQNIAGGQSDKVMLSEGISSNKAGGAQKISDPATTDSRMLLLIAIIEALTGKKVILLDMDEINNAGEEANKSAEKLQEELARQGNGNQGWGIRFTSTETYSEQEKTVFLAQGVITTSNGEETKFSIDLSMERSLSASRTISFKAGDAVKDPLVVNFSGAPVELTARSFKFDLNIDNKAENIHFVTSGSGFLFLDKNSDKKVNNGSELFGPSTGNGFDELASYDEDGNGWIDENDSVYDKLGVWSKDQQGNDIFYNLKELDIGAIYTGNIRTEFNLNDKNNIQKGIVRQSGVYLKENGSAGTIQKIDLVV